MRMRRYAIGTIMITIAFAAGCGSDEADTGGAPTAGPTATIAVTTAPAPSSPSSPATSGTESESGTLKVGSSPWGSILTDGEGRTLYALTSDVNGTSSCFTECEKKWPPLIGTFTAEAGVASSMIDKTERIGGAAQVVYGKWPLYHFSGDTNPGDMKGQGVGGVWYVVKPNGKLIKTEN